MPMYNKLVRDHIPDIISNNGKQFQIRVLNKNEYFTELRLKLKEELDEYLNTNTNEHAIEELADMLEIIYTLANEHGISLDVLENIRKEKVRKRGGFKEKIFLIDVQDD
ncbi:nucleoside triphosphate pyrophosphohydrolase [Chengkuizengella marina]|uniref:Phosphoribosyl-ATP pyrophosphohydrolase n=1 Tax=Chengkuizengella marina TaxID=2507566 RepID=A0A6N9Q1V0_9BACL|nr:nucleoside triphosphate pyrophosphohydrolase [Chengkuizengella marina]NBI28164.1 phosphoribosyl-ATP pyrophosphohydrolase [Chengkuizengella marina]